MDTTIGDVQQLLARYVGQLVNGCGNSRCTEMQCLTGHLNTQHQPVRRLTLEAARATALAICDGVEPRSHLCRYYEGQPVLMQMGHTRLDHSSLVQQLIRTPQIRGLFEVDHRIEPQWAPLIGSPHRQLRALHASTAHLPGADFMTNDSLADTLGHHIHQLLDGAPLTRLAPWYWVDAEVISKSNAYPSVNLENPADPSYNTWLAILDVLNNGPEISLMDSICRIVAKRCWLEHSLTMENPGRSREPSASLCNMIVSRLIGNNSFDKAVALSIWLKSLFAREWDATPMILRGSTCYGILELIRALHDGMVALFFPRTEIFFMRFLTSHLSVPELAESWTAGGIHLLRYHFLFPTDELYFIFRTINHITMRDAQLLAWQARKIREKVTQVEIQDLDEQQRYAETSALVLSVSRQDMLRDTYDQLWHRRKGELRRPLRVRLGANDEHQLGQDLGGVQMEFFNLLCREILNEECHMFTTEPQTGCSFFRVGSLQPLSMFGYFGVLLALAMYNGITLPVTLPRAFYHFLIERTPPDRLDMLDDGWPEIARSLRALKDEDIEDLDFTFDLNANGLHMSVLSPRQGGFKKFAKCHPDSSSAPPVLEVVDQYPKNFDLSEIVWPGWKFERAKANAERVDPANKQRYIQDKILWHTYASVGPQIWAAIDGFDSANLFPPMLLKSMFTTSTLKSYVEGVDHLDIDQLRATAKYTGYHRNEEYIRTFWRVVSSWPQIKQKQLLKFVTAAERIPISGPSQLLFIIKRVDHPELLPTSHTCFGTLDLPRYESPVVMEQKLSLALKYGSEGFGLI